MDGIQLSGVPMMAVRNDALGFDGTAMILMSHMVIQAKEEILCGMLSQISYKDRFCLLSKVN